MRRMMYECYLEGRRHAHRGGGLSGCPYAGLDGMAWKDGVRTWLDQTHLTVAEMAAYGSDENDQDGRGSETDAPGCPTRRDLDSTHIKTRPETGSQ